MNSNRIGQTMGVSAAAPPRTEDIHEAMDQLEKELSALGSAVDTLQSRLEPALRLPEPVCVGDGKSVAAPSCRSTLNNQLRDMAEIVGNNRRRINHILERLEI